MELGGLTDTSSAVLKHDFDAGTTTSHDLGRGRIGSEFVFVPAGAEAGEDEGWLMGYVYDRATDTSDLVILDAHDFGADPVADGARFPVVCPPASTATGCPTRS